MCYHDLYISICPFSKSNLLKAAIHCSTCSKLALALTGCIYACEVSWLIVRAECIFADLPGNQIHRCCMARGGTSESEVQCQLPRGTFNQSLHSSVPRSEVNVSIEVLSSWREISRDHTSSLSTRVWGVEDSSTHSGSATSTR